MQERVHQPKWHTVAEVAQMLGFGVSKTRMLIIEGEIRSVKVGRSRRILPQWVDEFIERRAKEAEDEWPLAL
ncbi:excisionase family DNA-binding protein [Qaidamihabitans albus]|uniref:excisionase family DNA-binding protein n=1 Tax=Qaidamihabitans albus TaxID=2795733 RepID=UPI0018F23DD3|nr:excisionase family DNA-binding protein [Qaidamihabitans albus]